MGSRYAVSQVMDYCFNPKHVVINDKHYLFPCNKCDGCLLHKANQWSRRISLECEHSVPLFFTLTYDNKYLPRLFPDFRKCYDYGTKFCCHCTLKCFSGYAVVGWFSDHDLNIRNNSISDVRRDDHIYIKDSPDYELSQVTDWNDYPTIQYCSKLDIQLFLKIISKFVYERFSTYGNFRYYIIGELGPLTKRCHSHGILFCKSVEVALFIKECCLYQAWQMCDSARLVPYTRISDGRIGNYVSNYVTGLSRLPKVYRENKQIRPFRLASKNPAIGYSAFTVQEIFEALYRRTIEYTRPEPAVGITYVLRYPSDFCRTIFPKCFEFASLSFSALLSVYGCLCEEVRRGSKYDYLLFNGFFDRFHSMDVQAMCKCFRITRRYQGQLGLTPWLYLFWLDQYYYLSDMYALRRMYQYEENFDFSLNENKNRLFLIYSDLSVALNDKEGFSLSDLAPYARLLESVGLDYSDFVDNPDFLLYLYSLSHLYRSEIEDILNNCEKKSKYNEKVLLSPTF